MKHYSTQELLAANNKAPLLIQEVLSSETTISTISNLGNKFRLHIDQIGLVAELNVQTLLGLIGPEEFLRELVAAGIADKDARAIMSEINQKIFAPLRVQEMKGGGMNASPSPAMSAAKPAEVKPPQVEPKPISIPTLIVPKLPNNFVSQEQQKGPISLPVRPALFAAPKPITGNTLLEDHQEPHIEFNKAPVPPTPSRTVLSATSLSQGINRIISEARPTPISQKANVAAPVFQPKQIPPLAPVAVAPKAPLPPSKSYSTDPYREPIDEK